MKEMFIDKVRNIEVIIYPMIALTFLKLLYFVYVSLTTPFSQIWLHPGLLKKLIIKILPSENLCGLDWSGMFLILDFVRVYFKEQRPFLLKNNEYIFVFMKTVSYPGFYYHEVTPLPGALEAPHLLNHVTALQNFTVSLFYQPLYARPYWRCRAA